jgi:hypothetical protein
MRRLALFAVLCTSSCAAPDYDHLRLAAGNRLEYHDGFVRLLHGEALFVEATPISLATPGFGPFDVVELRSHNEDIFAILPGIGLDEHVFVGVGPGRTHFDVVLDGEVVEEIQAIVMEPREEHD